MIINKISFTILLYSVIFIAACSPEANHTTSSNLEATVPYEPTLQPAEQEKPEIFDGPFGLKMGLTYAEVKKIIPDLNLSKTNPHFSDSRNIPKPHPNFGGYSFQFSDKTGLCRISALGKQIETGKDGAQIQQEFSLLDEALTSKYGNGKKLDFASRDYGTPEFWMLYLLENDRTLYKSWSKETKANLSNEIESISIKAYAESLSKGYLTLRYEFKNFSDCYEENKINTNKSL